MALSITWHGLTCFEIQSKIDKDEAVVITDPYDSSSGLRVPRTLAADVVTISRNNPLCNNLEAIKSDTAVVVSAPGEYEIKGIFVYGTTSSPEKTKDQTIFYRLEMENISLVHLGDLSYGPSAKDLEIIGEPDILFVPVSGEKTIDVKKIAAIVTAIDPRIVIPMSYDIPNLKIKLDPVEKLLKELGVKNQETTKKIKVSKKDLTGEEMKVVVLERE
jgi:L-ascorbate metabolism protein UlaG (beta-lactamase superfamily)